MSVEVDTIAQGRDLAPLLKWLAEVLTRWEDERWSLRLHLKAVRDEDCHGEERG